MLMVRRDPIGTTLTLTQYGQWLRERSQLSLGGTPLWAAIQTEPAPQLVEQIRLLSQGQAPAIGLQEAQLRMLVHAALAAGVRGLCFTSNSRLDGTDDATKRRAAMVELLNLELALIDRWPATGSFASSAKTNDPHVSGAVIETDQSRLMLPIFAPPNSQFVMGNTAVKALSFVVSGVPEGYDAYELSPTSFRPLPSERKPGGTRVILGEATRDSYVSERDSLIVFTQDPGVIRGISTRMAKIRARRATHARHRQRRIDSKRSDRTALGRTGRAIPVTRPRRAAAQSDLQQSETLLKTDVAAGYYRARLAQQSLRRFKAHTGTAPYRKRNGRSSTRSRPPSSRCRSTIASRTS